jgi:hypothetical protein
MAKATQPHHKATREDLRLRLTQHQQLCWHGSSTHQALFEKTLALYTTYHIHGCLGPPNELETSRYMDNSFQSDWGTQIKKARRGHSAKLTCAGQLLFDYDHTGKAFIR